MDNKQPGFRATRIKLNKRLRGVVVGIPFFGDLKLGKNAANGALLE